MDDLEQLRSTTLGMHFAATAAVNALIATHPDPTSLRRALERQRQVALVYMTNSHLPENTLEAFHKGWELLLADTPSSLPDGS